MTKLQTVRGTKDLLPNEAQVHRWILNEALSLGETYRLQEIETPIFEATEVFARTLGDDSDVVSKEMYTFLDRGGESLTLRPEGTAGIARALISNSLFHELPLKFIYHGSMFRYERPQKGRQRQFHQIGIELLGMEPLLSDIEAIAFGHQLLTRIGVVEKVRLHLNSLGTSKTRAVYRTELVKYLRQNYDALSEESKKRLEKNPLRALDSKDEKDQEICAKAPLMGDFFDAEAKIYFDALCSSLKDLSIDFVYDPKLVRGLDYYDHTVFEFRTDALGAHDAVIGGGRYNGLVELMGGAATSGVGWAAGMERLALLVSPSDFSRRPLAILPLDEKAFGAAIRIMTQLRTRNVSCELIGLSGNLGKRFKKANKINAKAALILGEKELLQNTVMFKDLDLGEQTEVALEVDSILHCLSKAFLP